MTLPALVLPASVTNSAIIACVDIGDRAREIALAAVTYAQWLQRQLIFFHAIEFDRPHAHMHDPLDWQLRRGSAEQRLFSLAKTFPGLKQSPFVMVEEGDWPSMLSDRMLASPDTIIVIGRSRRGSTGQLVTRLLAVGARKILIIPPYYQGSKEGPLRIAIPIDGSSFAEAALANAVTIARSRPAELLLAHIMPMPGIELFGPPASRDLELRMLIDKRNEVVACSFLEATLRRLRALGLSARSRCEKGDARTCLGDLLAEEEPDLVMISARGQGLKTCADISVGSTASYLVDHLDVPVMLIRGMELAGKQGEPLAIPYRRSGIERRSSNIPTVVAG